MVETANTKAATTSVAAKKPEVKKSIDENRLKNIDDTALWTVIGIKDCPWTEKAIKLLEEHKEEFKHIILNPEWQRRLIVQYNTRKSPAIFKGASYFGSYTQLEDHYKCWYFSEREKF